MNGVAAPVAGAEPLGEPAVVALGAHGLVAGYRRGRRAVPIVAADAVAARRGELTAVIGPNGSGKSTLLRTLTGTLPALAGDVTIDGQPLRRLDRKAKARLLAVVFTDRVDAGLLTVGDVIALGRHPFTDWRGTLDGADMQAAHGAAAQVGVAGLWTRPFAELSDGQRQRVMIARALAQEPTVLVLDEPSAFLDLPGRVELAGLLTGLAHRHGLAVVVSSHELELTLGGADRVWVVHDGTVAEGTPMELVASGRLADAFPTITITIDPATRSVTARPRRRESAP